MLPETVLVELLGLVLDQCSLDHSMRRISTHAAVLLGAAKAEDRRIDVWDGGDKGRVVQVGVAGRLL